MISGDPYADFDANERRLQKIREQYPVKRHKCDKCGWCIEEGYDYFFISIDGFDDITLCEECNSEFKVIV